MTPQPEPSRPKLCVLLAEDTRTMRLIAKRLLMLDGYEVIEAEDGELALQAFRENRDRIDAAVLDVQMPGLNGFELAQAIRSEAPRWIPILFCSGESEKSSIRLGNEIGNDYLVKPLDYDLLSAKMKSFARTVDTMRALDLSRSTIESMHEQLLDESRMAGQLISKISLPAGMFKCLQYTVRAGEQVSGDTVSAIEDATGRISVMLVDAAGHGLPAAVTLLLAVRCFKTMAQKGFSPAEIALEMNRQHREQFSVARYLAAAIVRYDPYDSAIEVWNGGLPPVRVSRPGFGRLLEIGSTGFPIGVVPQSQFFPETVTAQTLLGDQVYLASDGFTEPMGVLWDDISSTPDMLSFPEIWKLLEGHDCHDDATLCCLTCYMPQAADDDAAPPPEDLFDEGLCFPEFAAGVEFSAPLLRRHGSQCKDKALDALAALGFDQAARTPKFALVFTEAFANALEHGVLRMDSALKDLPDGLQNWERLRQERLAALDQGFIRVKATLDLPSRLAYCKITDSGSGFAESALQGGSKKSGRGIALCRSLSKSFRFADSGRSCIFCVPF